MGACIGTEAPGLAGLFVASVVMAVLPVGTPAAP
jgi:hypothetical protein